MTTSDDGANGKLTDCQPSESNGPNNGSPRTAVCDSCGAGPHPRDPDICARGHFLKENAKRGKASSRFLQDHEEQVIPARDRHLRDLGYRDPTNAPQHVVDSATFAAEMPLLLARARSGNRMATYAQLLDRYDRIVKSLDGMRVDTAHRHSPPAAERSALSFATRDELKALEHHYHDVIARGEARRTGGEPRFDPTAPRLGEALPTGAQPDRLGGLPVQRSQPPQPVAQPASDARLEPPPSRAPEPEPLPAVSAVSAPAPESFPGITEPFVRETLRLEGDDTLRDYESGRLLKFDAYARAAARLREMNSLRERGPK